MAKHHILLEDNVVDNLTSTSTTAPLSANQGKVLNDSKVAVAQGVAHAGEFLKVGADGNVTTGAGGASDYNDLTNKPQINAVTLSGDKTSEQLGIVVNLTKSQYDALTSEEKMSGKIYCTTDEGTTADYTDLTNKPSINSVTLSGNKTSAELGVQNVPLVVSQSAPSAITIADNTEYILTDVSTLTFIYPASGSYSAFIRMTTASSGTITVAFPSSMYVPKVPTFGNGETWLLGIENGIVIAQKAVAS